MPADSQLLSDAQQGVLGPLSWAVNREDVYFGWSNSDSMNGGDGHDSIRGAAGGDTLNGDAGDDRLYGGTGDDRLDGGWGSDTIEGGEGNDNDTYKFERGNGQDITSDYDATSDNVDVVAFGGDVAAEQLWFRQVGSNLEVSIIGTDDKFTISDWYSGSGYHAEQFKTSDGKTLLDSQVQNLVQAMASFSPPAGGQTTLPPNYQDSLAPVIAANWQ